MKLTELEIVEALETAIKTGDAPIGKHWACTISKLTAKEALELINRQKAEIERLLKIAKKMHTWIFLHSVDEEEAYKECGLSPEENASLGYWGKIIFEETDGDAE